MNTALILPALPTPDSQGHPSFHPGKEFLRKREKQGKRIPFLELLFFF